MLHFALPNVSAILCFLNSHASKQCPAVSMESERKIIIHNPSAGYKIRLTGKDSKQYEPNAIPKITCNKQGKVVDLSLPKSLEICSVPLILKNGVITSSRPNDQAIVLQNDVLTHNCDNGFGLVGAVQLTCESTGNFDNASPVCKKICPIPLSPANGAFTSRLGTVMQVLELDVLTFSCNFGYQIEGATNLTCLSNGHFNFETPLCKRICPNPTIVAQASIVIQDRKPNSTYLVLENEKVAYTCDLGYHLVGNSILKCLADGSYDLVEPVCKKTCPNPIEPADGVLTSNATSGQILELDIVNVTCNSGYLIEGPSLITCLSIGNFDSTMPSCKRICPSPSIVQHASVATSNGTNISTSLVLEMETVSYRCASGYHLVGNANLTCLANGSYNAVSPVCKKECLDKIYDILFVVDGSGSISADEFKNQSGFIKKLISQFSVGRMDSHVAYLQFGTDNKLEWNFNEYYDFAALNGSVDNVVQLGSLTYLGKALMAANTSALTKDQGRRVGVQGIVFILTDGRSSDDPIPGATAIAASGNEVWVIGVGSGVDQTQLANVASDPSKMIMASDFNDLDSVLTTLAERRCPSV